ASLLIAAGILALGAGVTIYAGVYDVAATEPHWPATGWILETARIRSIKPHATGIAAPPGFDDPAKIPIGVGHFAAHCAVCHGAPGVPGGTSPAASIRRRPTWLLPPNPTAPPSFSGYSSTASR